jgi:hypothetical protein
MHHAGSWPRRVALAALTLAGLLGAASAEPLEYAVKAAYLAKFPFYVEWPAASLPAPNSPIVICIVGDDPFGQVIDDAIVGQQVQGRPLAVRRLKAATRDAGCHVAYTGAEGRAETLRGPGVLLVTDVPNGAGIVNFVVKENRVRFTVDDEAAAQAGLLVSSKLLSVAVAVKPRGGSK